VNRADPAIQHAAWAAEALDAMFARVFAHLAPPEPLSMVEWVEKHRMLSKEETDDYPGPFSLDNVPHLRGILAELGRKGIKRAVAQKPAQWSWTSGVTCTVLGYHVHQRPCVQVVMFPRDQSAKDFNDEKFAPMVRSTPVLAERIKLKSRSDGNSSKRKRYPGGLAKFVASNSPADVKSTTARVLIVEEPDDVNKDVKGQGNAIALLRERGKTVRTSFELIGGTPTVKGASEIEKEMLTTDQRRFMVACHHCGERHEVEWEHVVIPGLNLTAEELADPQVDTKWPNREVYGRARWEDAYYVCPHCGGIWTDDDRIANIRRAALVPPLYGWEPTARSLDPGWYGNELQSTFDGCRVPVLAKKFLRAQYLLDRGDPTEMVIFFNTSRGRTWEYRGELPEEDELRNRAEAYAEWSCPAGGLEILVTVDVQHDRLAVTVWAVGRGEECWLVYWGELWGQTIVQHAGAWDELEQLLDEHTVTHPTGVELPISAVAIDTGDGQTSDASYAFVRKHSRRDRPVFATKGASDQLGRVEIWSKPRAVDPNKRATKASRAGLQVHAIGTTKAKDLLLGWATEAGRVRLTGTGPGRMHWYRGVRDDFFEQILGEMKVPKKTNPALRVWTPRLDRRHEVLDCAVMLLWLMRQQRLHIRKPADWDAAERRIQREAERLTKPAPAQPVAAPVVQQAVRSPVAKSDWSSRL
jgi:phage terminase large subunit GpA-like protein